MKLINLKEILFADIKNNKGKFKLIEVTIIINSVKEVLKINNTNSRTIIDYINSIDKNEITHISWVITWTAKERLMIDIRNFKDRIKYLKMKIITPVNIEIIEVDADNLNAKLNYIDTTYDKNLVMIKNNKVRITEWDILIEGSGSGLPVQFEVQAN